MKPDEGSRNCGRRSLTGRQTEYQGEYKRSLRTNKLLQTFWMTCQNWLEAGGYPKICKSLFGEKIVPKLKGRGGVPHSIVTCLPIAGVLVQMKPISSLCGPIICNMTSFVQAASYVVIAYYQVFIAMLLTDIHLYHFYSAIFFSVKWGGEGGWNHGTHDITITDKIHKAVFEIIADDTSTFDIKVPPLSSDSEVNLESIWSCHTITSRPLPVNC